MPFARERCGLSWLADLAAGLAAIFVVLGVTVFVLWWFA